MSTKVLVSKIGLKLACDVSANPVPRPRQVFPLPDLAPAMYSFFSLALDPGDRAILATIDAILPNPSAAWTLTWRILNLAVFRKAASVPVVAGEVVTIGNALPDATYEFTLRSTNAAGEVVSYIAKTIATPVSYALGSEADVAAAQASADAAAALAGSGVKPLAFWDFAGGALPSGWTFPGNVSSADSATTTNFGSTAADQSLRVACSLAPASAYVVAMRVKLDLGPWEGILFFSNGVHGEHSGYYKSIPAPPVGVWTTIVLDLRTLTSGGTDFMDGGTVTNLRFDFVENQYCSVTVDWIAVGVYGAVSQGDLDLLISDLVRIGSDGWLHRSEKPKIISEKASADAEYSDLVSKADAVGVPSGTYGWVDVGPDAFQISYKGAKFVLDWLLGTKIVDWNNVATDSVIWDPLQWGNIFASYYAHRTKLQSAIASKLTQRTGVPLYAKGTGYNHNSPRSVLLDGVEKTGIGRGLYLVRIRRSDLAVTYQGNFDTYASSSDRASLGAILNDPTTDSIMVLTSCDAIGWDDDLVSKVNRCGGNIPDVSRYAGRYPYVLIGIPGIGRGNGLQVVSGLGANDPYAEINVNIINGVPAGMSGNAGAAQEAADLAIAAANSALAKVPKLVATIASVTPPGDHEFTEGNIVLDVTTGFLHQCSASNAWIKPNIPAELLVGTLTAGIVGAAALAADLGIVNVIRSSGYDGTASTQSTTGFKFSGTLFTAKKADGSTKQVMADWSGQMLMAGYEVQTVADKVMNNMATLTGSGNWVCPAGVTRVEAILIGGGGSGAKYTNGGGGGGGGCSLKFFVDVTPGTSYAFSVGQGGSGNSTNGNSGTSTTMFGKSANGGLCPPGSSQSGGASDTVIYSDAYGDSALDGPSGGSGLNGADANVSHGVHLTVIATGGNGGSGGNSTTSGFGGKCGAVTRLYYSLRPAYCGGDGGCSMLSKGGRGLGSGITAPAHDAPGFGGGGGGATLSDTRGGNGAPGTIMLRW